MAEKKANARWQMILDYSEKLIAMADKSDWESMQDIAVKRDNLIKKYFADNPTNENNAQQHQKNILDLLNLDKGILNNYKKDHASLSEDFLSLRNASKAVTAYHNCP